MYEQTEVKHLWWKIVYAIKSIRAKKNRSLYLVSTKFHFWGKNKNKNETWSLRKTLVTVKEIIKCPKFFTTQLFWYFDSMNSLWIECFFMVFLQKRSLFSWSQHHTDIEKLNSFYFNFDPKNNFHSFAPKLDWQKWLDVFERHFYNLLYFT